MYIINSLAILAIITGSTNSKNATNIQKRQDMRCSKQVQRQEIRELSPERRTKLFEAIRKLNEAGESSPFNSIAKIHLDYAGESHGVSAFLPWHRKFLNYYELELQKIDPEIIIPYWDWSIDSQSPESSVILSDDFYGTNGDSNSQKCLKSGFFKDQQVHTPNTHCLKRDFDGGNKISAFYSSEALEFVLNQPDYDSFRKRLESAPHARVHIGLGGNEGDIMTMYSTNDPLFFLHHAFIDLLWNEWQLRHPTAGQYSASQGSENDQLAPFNINVKEALSTQSYCYTYPRYHGNAAPTGNDQQSSDEDNNVGGELQRRALLDSVKDLTKGTSKLSGIVNNAIKSVTNLLDELSDIKLGAFDRDSSKKDMVREPLVISEGYATKNNIPYDEMLQYQLEIKKQVIDKHNSKYM